MDDKIRVGDTFTDRIKATSKNRGQDVNKSLRLYAFHGLVARLQSSPWAGRWALKGGMLIIALDPTSARTTDDADFAVDRHYGLDGFIAAVREVIATPVPEDGLSFDIQEHRCQLIREESDNPTVRLYIEARLHNRDGGVQIPLKLDASPGDTYDAAFVEMPPVCKGYQPVAIPCFAWSTVLAQKIHAIVDKGMANPRMRDFWDIIKISRTLTDLDKGAVVNAIFATFAERGTRIDTYPVGLTARFAAQKERIGGWPKLMSGKGMDRDAPRDLHEAVEEVAAFVLPLLEQAAERAAENETPTMSRKFG